MVHPYLRRRAGMEAVSYPHLLLEPVLRETLGVLLFQEQVIRVTTVLAGFSAGEADLLRRALSRSRPGEELSALRERFVKGAQTQGIDATTADGVFSQLAGYAGYGFCKSHSASFALIAYQSLWLKHYHPAPFYCALLNQQPMGFYAPEVIIGDARRHGVDLLPPDIRYSALAYTLEKKPSERWALRAGLSAVTGMGEQGYARIAAARTQQEFHDLGDCCRRTRLAKDLVANLIRAGAVDGFGERRQLLWQLGAIDYRPDEFNLDTPPIPIDLPPLGALEQTVWEYELLGLAPDTQILTHYRAALRRAHVYSTWEVKRQTQQLPNGVRVRVAGMVVVRQHPATAKGIVFISLEDESGLLDLVVRPDVYARVRHVLRGHVLIVAEGIIQRAEAATSVLVYHMWPLMEPAH